MSFDNTELPEILLAELYKNSLVVIESDKAAVEKTAPAKAKKKPVAAEKTVVETQPPAIAKGLSYLGDNNSHISIIVKDAGAVHLDDASLAFLSSVLTACKLNLADVAIVNMQNQEVDDILLRAELAPKTVLLFGISSSEIGLPFSIPDYKPQPFNNCTYLQSAPLDKMTGTDKEAKLEKSRLWVCLKTLFNV
ncbi:MAG: hypothetical protein K0Q66_1733 [Chitinophagaceae bacterium]|jgi:hypothetical protein|nr:hypothetical protein [Chitinophagaceae bacterium]